MLFMPTLRAQTRTTCTESHRQPKLLKTLDYCRSFQATDPRDIVHGLLALVDVEKDIKALTVDYNKDVGEVYTDVVITKI